jgi:thioredoxin reductase
VSGNPAQRGAKVGVVGAGSSGIAACQVLQARGIAFDCFEMGSEVGGLWRYDNDNGLSSAYRALHINSSRYMMEYRSFGMPDDYPDYPHHTQIARYFDAFVDHFGFRDRIRFRTEVVAVEPAGGRWRVSWRGSDGERGTDSYDAVLVAAGHHWQPRWPDPPFPGEFAGREMHSHHYRSAEEMAGDRVLVVGFGNSAMDIACETSHVSRATYLSVRRGGWVVPKYLHGKPTDQLGSELVTRLPFRLLRFLYARQVIAVQGRPEAYGLPKPDHRLGEAHPTVSDEILSRIGHGRVAPKPNIERLEGGRVRFVDGSVEEVDTIVYCTGYDVRFPFLARSIIDTEDNRVSLYRRVVHPDHPGLFFIGLIQVLGAVMPLAEAQSEWVADVIEGKAPLPSPREMKRIIAREDRRMRKRYAASRRHTMQVDFYQYLRTIRREQRRGGLGSVIARHSHEFGI